MCVDGRASSSSPANQARAGRAEDAAADREAATQRHGGRDREGLRSSSSGASRPSSSTPLQSGSRRSMTATSARHDAALCGSSFHQAGRTPRL